MVIYSYIPLIIVFFILLCGSVPPTVVYYQIVIGKLYIYLL